MRHIYAISVLLFFASCAFAQEDSPSQVQFSSYLANPRYCEKDSDCALREAACGLKREPMNIHYDNSKLIAMRPYIECDISGTYVNPRCEENNCVADMINEEEFVACTMDAKMCPNGSFVGRTGPMCEFEKCPGED